MSKVSLKDIDLLVLDFDGVLTDNKVLLTQDGIEIVICNRSDGLAFDALKKLNMEVIILSTEKNSVVTKRAQKLQVLVRQGINNKLESIKELAHEKELDLKRIFYIGNDLNDYAAMQACGFSACPLDSHSKIKEISTFILDTKGGDGVVRDFVENIIELEILEILYGEI